MLELEALDAYYGASRVLNKVSLRVNAGETVGLLGRNGSGKTTLLKSILGLVTIRSGQIFFNSQKISGLVAHKIPRLGIAYMPQNQRVFPTLTVLENLKLAALKGKFDWRSLEATLERFPQLKGRLKQPAGTLSGGEQQILAIARALMPRPKLLLLDEPTEGLMPSLVAAVEDAINAAKEGGTGVLMAEQNLGTALKLCDRVYILEKGTIMLEKPVNELSERELQKHLGLGLPEVAF